jgi:hypothetical protein
MTDPGFLPLASAVLPPFKTRQNFAYIDKSLPTEPRGRSHSQVKLADDFAVRVFRSRTANAWNAG